MEPKRTLHSGKGHLWNQILLRDEQEGYRNFNLEEEERFIKKLVDAEVASKPILARGELLDRGQRRKLQLYGERES